MDFLTYLFWPNPGNLHYNDLRALVPLAVMAFLIASSFWLTFWRRSLVNPVTRKLSRSWSSALFWFGAVGIVLIVSRVEGILFLSMRFLWIVWVLALAAYVAFQVRQFRQRHYVVVKQEKDVDTRDQYLPKRKRKK